MKFTSKIKRVIIMLSVISYFAFASEIELEESRTWVVQTKDKVKLKLIRELFPAESLIPTIWGGDKKSGTKDNPIILNQVNTEQLICINNLLQGKKIDEIDCSEIFLLIKTLNYLGIDFLIENIILSEPKFKIQSMPPGGEVICMMLLQKNKNQTEFCEKLINLIVQTGNNPEIISKFLNGKPSLKKVAVQLKTNTVMEKVKAFETYKQLSFREQKALKRIQQSQLQEYAEDITEK